MEAVLLFATVISPVILALVELIKRSVSFPKNYVPAVAFVVGLLVGVVSYPFTDLSLSLRLWAGGLAALAATGLFEVGNNREGMTRGMDDAD
ncbi:holin [Halalkalibacter oceani]|uniref:Holin n=1 Tax=Halalkalibacter oceani TaxID=1653776 RepID=A0A9X2DT15_9BACI|nr:holin [Halalkalibacter oceani]MCM3715922.1 holin [Halalkalibacter oceani]MCM3761149.1 holin [Halalkalibacter oceani]